MSQDFTYEELLSRLETEHKKEVTDLITKTKTFDKLIWRNLSRDLDDIYERYKGKTLAVAIDYILKNQESILDKINDEQASFKKFCNLQFDETYDYFEKTNGLI